MPSAAGLLDGWLKLSEEIRVSLKEQSKWLE
jgi:hypothetical protein